MGASLADALAADLRTRVRGQVIVPGDADYDRRRALFNARIDARPAAIVRCISRDDVIAALAVRAERGIPVSVRAGGGSDRAATDGGIVIDVSPLKGIQVDPAARSARVGAGVTWAEMDAATQQHGLTLTGARVSSLSVADVTLGGGSGWLERLLGPTCQSLAAAEVVLADGQVVRATEDENPELLWGLRGGGNFAVVTELGFRLHAVGPNLLCGFLAYSRDQVCMVARHYRDYVRAAPPQVGGGLILFSGRGGPFWVVFCFAGDPRAGERAAAPLRELGPSLDALSVNEYRAFQAMTDLQHPSGMRSCLREGYLPELSDEALDAAIAHASRPASSLSQVLLTPLGGAISRLDANAMALRVPRGASWAYRCLSLWPPLPELDAGNVEWAESFSAAMRPFALAQPAVPEKLHQVKRRYDPCDVFGAQAYPAVRDLAGNQR